MRAIPFAGLWILLALFPLLLFTGCLQTPAGNSSQPAAFEITPVQTTYVPAEATVNPTYIVAAMVSRSTERTIEITYEGGKDAGYLQYISVTVDGANEGSVGPVRSAGSLPVGTSELFAAHDPGQDHVVGTGHFNNNGMVTDQVVIDTTI